MDRKADWQQWLPELEAQFKDRMLSLVSERFKLTSIAQQVSSMGAKNLEEALKVIFQVAPEAQKRYPKYAWLDSVYKYLGDSHR